MLRRALVPAARHRRALVGSGGSVVDSRHQVAAMALDRVTVNPWDPASRDVAFYVHTMLREGVPSVSDVTGTAYGLVNGARRSVPLQFGATGRPGVLSVRRSWPAEGSWVLRVSLLTTTALLTLDREGNVASVRIPTERTPGGVVPREVAQREVDSTLAEISER